MSEKNPQEICEAIALDFKRRKISHQEAAELTGKTKASISNQISGKKPFSKGMAELFANAFDYNLDFLLYGRGELSGISPTDYSRYSTVAIDADNLEHSMLAAMIEASDSLIHLSENQAVIDTWSALVSGNFERYREGIINLSNEKNIRTLPMFSAKLLCENIKKQLGDFMPAQYRIPE